MWKDKEEILLPYSQETRDHWYDILVANHERLFPININLTTVMFLVVSDLREAQKETHKFPFSPGNECHCLHL